MVCDYFSLGALETSFFYLLSSDKIGLDRSNVFSSMRERHSNLGV